MSEYTVKEEYELFSKSEIIAKLKQEQRKHSDVSRKTRIKNAIQIVKQTFHEVHPPIAALDITEDGNYCVMEIIGGVIIGMYVTDEGFQGFTYGE